MIRIRYLNYDTRTVREWIAFKKQRQDGGQPFSYGIMVIAWEEDAEV